MMIEVRYRTINNAILGMHIGSARVFGSTRAKVHVHPNVDPSPGHESSR